MADKTIQLPLGGEVMGADTLASQTTGNWLVPLGYVQNFVPIVISPSIGGQKQLKFVKRRSYGSKIYAPGTSYVQSCAFQWTGVQSAGGSLLDTSRGVLVWTEEKAGAGGDLLLKQYAAASISTLGTFSTINYRCIGIQETLISGVPNLTLNVKLTSSPYTQKALFYPSGGALTEITDGDFPTTSIGNFVHLDGYAFIASTDGYIYNSDLNSVSSWTANNRIAVQMVPDSLVGLAKIRSIILALGTGSIEVFENRGALSGSPLTTVQGRAIRMGVLHQRAVQEVGDTIYFVSVSSEGVGVYQLDAGGAPKKVSNALIDMNLVNCANDVVNTPTAGPLPTVGSKKVYFGGVIKTFGITLIPLYIDGVCYAYCPSADVWMTNVVGAGTLMAPLFLAVGGQTVAIDIKQTGTNSSLMAYIGGQGGSDSEGPSDALYQAIIVTPPLSLGTSKRKRYKELKIIGDPIASATCPIVVSYSDDNGQNFTTWGTIDMNVNPPASLWRGKTSRRRIWKFSNSSNTGCEIDAVELTYEELRD